MSNDLGIDRSGNGNNWTVNNITNSDQMVDSPTNNFATLNPLLPHTQTLSEGNLKVSNSVQVPSLSTIGASTGKWYAEVHFVSGTHCRIGIANESGVNQNFGYGTGSGNSWIKINGTGFYHDSAHISSQGQSISAGDIVMMAVDVDAGKMWWGKNGVWDDNASGTGVPASGTNPTYTDTGISNGGKIFFGVCSGSGALVFTTNFGQDSSFAGNKTAQGNQDGNSIGDFYYTPPTGFLALCTSNLPDVAVTPSEHFNTVLYSGNSSTNAITGVGFQPDFTWFKARSDARSHSLVDSVRGFNGTSARVLQSESTNAEWESSAINSLDSDGFTVSSSNNYINNSSHTYVAWNWKANTTPSKTYAVTVVSDSGNKYRFDGFGTSAVTLDLQEGGTYKFDQSHSSNSGHPFRFGTSANGSDYTTGVTTSGTPGNSGAYTQITVAAGASTLYYACSAHSGMGGQANTNSTSGSSNFSGTIQSNISANVDSGFSIVSYTGTGANATVGHGLSLAPEIMFIKGRENTHPFNVYHKDLGTTYWLYTNSTLAVGASGTNRFNSTAPDSTKFSLGSSANINESTKGMIAYCFHSVDGYSKVGSYTGNGSTTDGNQPFVYTGFRPAWLILKRAIGGTEHWYIVDNKRNTYNVVNNNIKPNSSTAEETGFKLFDFTSNGFKIRTTDTTINYSGSDFIYIAFAETPFKNSNAR